VSVFFKSTGLTADWKFVGQARCLPHLYRQPERSPYN